MDKSSKNSSQIQKNAHGRVFIHLRTKLIVIFSSIMVVVSLLIVLLVYKVGGQTIKASATNTYMHGLKYSVDIIDETLSNIEALMYPVMMDSSTTTRLRSYSSASDYDKYTTDSYFLNHLKNIVLQNKYIDSAYILYAQGETLVGTGLSHTYTREELERAGWLERIYSLKSDMGCWTITSPIDAPEHQTVTNIKWILGSENSKYAALIVNVSTELWSAVSERNSGTAFSCICRDGVGSIMSADNTLSEEYQRALIEQAAALGTPEGSFAYGEYMIGCMLSPQSGWLYIGAARSADLLHDLGEFRSVIIFAISLIIIFTTFLLVIITSHIMHPINVLSSAMKQVGRGDFRCHISEERNDDFATLYDGFNSMVVNLDTSVKTIYKQQMEKKDLSMQILRSQLNAHFLYNTLDSIHWIAKMNNADTASELIMHLADYYRKTLNHGKDTITLRDAVALANSYLEICRIESDSPLIFKTDIPESTLSRRILKSTIQPLLENSVQHGQTDPTRGDFVMTLSVRENTELGTMTVRLNDNGRGIPAARLAELKASLNEEVKLEGGFALKNINAQIKTYYGVEYGLDVESVDGEYTTCIITVPITD